MWYSRLIDIADDGPASGPHHRFSTPSFTQRVVAIFDTSVAPNRGKEVGQMPTTIAVPRPAHRPHNPTYVVGAVAVAAIVALAIMLGSTSQRVALFSSHDEAMDDLMARDLVGASSPVPGAPQNPSPARVEAICRQAKADANAHVARIAALRPCQPDGVVVKAVVATLSNGYMAATVEVSNDGRKWSRVGSMFGPPSATATLMADLHAGVTAKHWRVRPAPMPGATPAVVSQVRYLR